MSGHAPERSLAEEAELHAERLPRAERKRHGVWFTPMELALPTAARALAPLLREFEPRTLRVVDPAVGGGTFLRAAQHALVAAGVPARDAVRCLHGLDVDGEAARLAALALHEAAGGVDFATIAANVRAGDGLLELEPGTFDAVLTNPPWETLHGPDAARAAALRARFVHQGRGKLFTYRLFVERTFQLLRPGGRLGLIVPASLWFDRDAEPLRRLLLDQCDWQWLFGFENRRRIFAIDGRYRFGVLIATKGGSTTSVRVAFGRTEVADWAASEPPHARYGRDELRALSPHSGAFVEIDDTRDLDVLRRMHQNARPLLGDGGAFTWRQGDFNMTADRAQFVEREQAERDGWRAGGDGVWRSGRGGELLPLYQGAMLNDLHPNTGAHRGGTGRATAWAPPPDVRELRPAYLVDAAAWRNAAAQRSPARLVHRALSNATNERTMIACLLGDEPCGNSLGVLTPARPAAMPLRGLAATAALLSSLAFDWALRLRLGGTNLNRFVLRDCVVPRLDDRAEAELARLALQLCAILPWHTYLWRAAHDEGWHDDDWGERAAPAIDAAERRTLATRIDVLAGRAFGLSRDDVAWIVRGCDQAAAPAHAKGFWRVERELPPHERRPARWLAALTAS